MREAGCAAMQNPVRADRLWRRICTMNEEDTGMCKQIFLLLLALLAALLFGSCSAIAHAVGSFISGVFWLVLTLASLIVWILYIFYDRTGKKELRRRWDKRGAQVERDTIEFF